MKVQNILSSLSVSVIGIKISDGPFESDIGIVNLHPSKGTLWVAYVNEKYFDSYSCGPPKKLSRFVIKRNGDCLFSEPKQKV